MVGSWDIFVVGWFGDVKMELRRNEQELWEERGRVSDFCRLGNLDLGDVWVRRQMPTTTRVKYAFSRDCKLAHTAI